MQYTEVDIRLDSTEPFSDILVARLNEIGFESYIEDKKGLKAYIQTTSLNINILKEILAEIPDVSYEIKNLKTKNWNQYWENNFQPVYINDKCVIRADFHDDFADFEYQIIITPKMSFGTGHHETTFLLITEMFNIDFNDKVVLDMGTGTGILAVLASKLGAKSIVGVDFDEWAYNNAHENAKLNAISNIHLLHGDVDLIASQKFDIIIANINRNTILKDLTCYVRSMNKKCDILLSGFLEEDSLVILERSEELGLDLVVSKHKNKWKMLHLKRV
tara:strand:+ start:384 stop:1208 length:825 start_codon:yes stop_codon:yes gene_type:complete